MSDALLDLFQAWLDARHSLYHEFSSDYDRSARIVLGEAGARARALGVNLSDLNLIYLQDDLDR